MRGRKQDEALSFTTKETATSKGKVFLETLCLKHSAGAGKVLKSAKKAATNGSSGSVRLT